MYHHMVNSGHVLHHHGGRPQRAVLETASLKFPVLSPSQLNDLKVLSVESAKNLVENPQKELADKYRYLEDTVTSQNDIGVLNYLDMIYSNGPDEAMLEAVRKTVGEDMYGYLFVQNAEDNIDGDDEDDEDDEETEDETEDEEAGFD